MKRILNYKIGRQEEGLRVEQYLRRLGYSRQNLVELKKFPKSVLVNGQEFYMNRKLTAGDEMTVTILEETAVQKIVPAALPLSILYEDEDILIVNKPAGMPVHPSMNNDRNSLANAVVWYYHQKGIPFVFRCGNRLDRDTSGLTVVAKHMLASTILSAMTFRRETGREYLAVVQGRPIQSSGTIDVPLGRKPGSVIERVADFENGERAVTHYRVLEEGGGHSLVLLRLETGRTHQIRIHMKYLGCPLIGDYLYNPDMSLIGRQALHSCRLTFAHPITGARMEFTAPLPEDMGEALKKLGIKGY